MKPPICAYCRKRFSPSSKEGGLVRFANYEPLPERMMGHPKGLAWFCEKHIEEAKTLKDKALNEALQTLKSRHA